MNAWIGVAVLLAFVARRALAEEAVDPRKLSAFAFDRDDRVRRTIELRWIRKGLPLANPRDGIPAIREPSSVPAAQDDLLTDEAPVVGLVVGGEARAYPLVMLDSHEVVNDTLGGVPVAMTYCPLCDSAVAVRRDFDWDPARAGETLTLGVSGYLYESDVLLYDSETETFWAQLTARGAVGPHAGAQLEVMPVSRTTWKAWREAHPATTVLSWRTEHKWPRERYAVSGYVNYRASKQQMFPTHAPDARLPRKSSVYGLSWGGEHLAIPETAVSTWKEPAVVTVGGRRFRVRWVPERATAVADTPAPPDPNTPSAADGPERWVETPLLKCYWFAWTAFHPGTKVWTPPDAPAGGGR